MGVEKWANAIVPVSECAPSPLDLDQKFLSLPDGNLSPHDLLRAF